MVTVEKFMRHGCENVPDYMLSGSRGDFTGVGDIHFFYSADEVLYGALPDFEEACKRANVPYTVSARPKMVHCYCMLPIFKEAKEDFAKIVDILKNEIGNGRVMIETRKEGHGTKRSHSRCVPNDGRKQFL